MRTDTELDGEAEEAMLRAAQQFDNEESDMLFQAENDNLSTESLWCEADREDFFPLGCHASREAAVQQFYDDIVEAFLAHPPAPPAFNKWTKFFPPVAWFASFC